MSTVAKGHESPLSGFAICQKYGISAKRFAEIITEPKFHFPKSVAQGPYGGLWDQQEVDEWIHMKW
jgi:predicted DNA-binding transcriptional regulator AlpA